MVLIGSDQSFIAKPGNSIYGATKGAIAQLTKAVALENAHYPVRVNCVCPGTIDTPLYRYAVERFVARTGTPLTEIEQELNQAQPLGRIGQASEVANVVDFLLSSQASFITGALIPVDGGYIAQ